MKSRRKDVSLMISSLRECPDMHCMASRVEIPFKTQLGFFGGAPRLPRPQNRIFKYSLESVVTLEQARIDEIDH